MCFSPMSFISPVGSMLFGGKKSGAALAGAALGGIPGALIGSSMAKKPKTQSAGG